MRKRLGSSLSDWDTSRTTGAASTTMGVLLRKADPAPHSPMVSHMPSAPIRRQSATALRISRSSRPDSSMAWAMTNREASAMMAGLPKAPCTSLGRTAPVKRRIAAPDRATTSARTLSQISAATTPASTIRVTSCSRVMATR